MKNARIYYSLAVRRQFGTLSSQLDEDITDLLEIEPAKRTNKQKKALAYMQQLKKSADNSNVNMKLITKLSNL